MGEGTTIRVAGPLAEELVAAQLAQPIASADRSGTLDLFVAVSVAVKDVSSVILAVAGGIQGLRAILDWLHGRDREEQVVLTINVPEGPRSWSLRTGHLDEETRREIGRVLEALADEQESAD